MPAFPSSGTSPSASPAPRYIGSVQLNDRVNTWFGAVTPPWPAVRKYEAHTNDNGAISRVRYDFKAPEIECTGMWIDGGGLLIADFIDMLRAVDRGALDWGDGWHYAQADVVDCVPNFRGWAQNPTTLDIPVKVWRWSIKCQTFTAVRG